MTLKAIEVVLMIVVVLVVMIIPISIILVRMIVPILEMVVTFVPLQLSHKQVFQNIDSTQFNPIIG